MPSGEDGTPGQYFKPSMFLGATRGIPVNDSVRKEIEPQLTDFDETIAAYQASLEGMLVPLAFLVPGPPALALTAVDVRRDVEFIP